MVTRPLTDPQRNVIAIVGDDTGGASGAPMQQPRVDGRHDDKGADDDEHE